MIHNIKNGDIKVETGALIIIIIIWIENFGFPLN